jgi:hypothetical protein
LCPRLRLDGHFSELLTAFHHLFHCNSAKAPEPAWHGFWSLSPARPATRLKTDLEILIIDKENVDMFDIENLLRLGVFSQLIPIWQVFFFIASLLPFLLWNRVKICLLITYLFTYYLGFMVQWGDYLSTSGSMQPFVLYSLSGLAIAVFFVSTIFSEQPERTKVRWVRYSAQPDDRDEPGRPSDPLETAVNVTNVSDIER